MLSSKSYFAQVALSLLIAPLIVAQTVCNGHSELCDRSYGNVTFVGAHDSYAVGSSGIAVNQDYNITQQLNDGVRLLQSQVHNSSGTIELCHTSCILYDGGPLSTYLSEVKAWMDANPNDVVTLLIVNSDDFEPTAFDTLFKAAGLDTLSYVPPSASITNEQWPTLGSMIGNGTRLVTFLDAMADFTSVTYLMAEFINVWETPYDVTTTTFDCTVNRTQGDSSSQLYLINHYLDSLILGQPAPDKTQANVTNGVSGVGSLGVQVSTCAAEYGRNPNYLLVDFYEYGGGSVFEVAATANGVTYSPTTPIATPITSGSSASSTSVTSTPNAAIPLLQLDWFKAMTIMGGVLLGACSVA